MNTIIGYANYDVLRHEKQTIFTFGNPHGQASISEKVEIELPGDFKIRENTAGETMIVTPDGATYLANEILLSFGGSPVMEWYDGEKVHRVTCSFKKVSMEDAK